MNTLPQKRLKIQLLDFGLILVLVALLIGWYVDHYRVSWRNDLEGNWAQPFDFGPPSFNPNRGFVWKFRSDGTYSVLGTLNPAELTRIDGEYEYLADGKILLSPQKLTYFDPVDGFKSTTSAPRGGAFKAGVDASGHLISHYIDHVYIAEVTVGTRKVTFPVLPTVMEPVDDDIDERWQKFVDSKTDDD